MSGKRPRALAAKSTRGAGDDYPSARQVEAFKHFIGSCRIAVLAHGRTSLVFDRAGLFEVKEVSTYWYIRESLLRRSLRPSIFSSLSPCEGLRRLVARGEVR